MVAQDAAMLYVRGHHALATPVKFYPIVHMSVPGLKAREGNAISFLSGLVYKIECFQMVCLNSSLNKVVFDRMSTTLKAPWNDESIKVKTLILISSYLFSFDVCTH